MEPLLQISTKAVNKWNNDYISPGAVASLGAVTHNVRLRQSSPNLPMRWMFDDKELVRRGGGNVQDGSVSNNGGLGASTVLNDYYQDRIETRVVGQKYQDIRRSDLTAHPRVMARPKDSWKAQEAQVVNAKVRGDAFLPLPGGYIQGGIPRNTGLNHNYVVDRQNVGPREDLTTSEEPVDDKCPIGKNPFQSKKTVTDRR